MLRPDWLILAVSRWGSRMSRYLETIRTEMKYTTAKARNWACLLSSCREGSQNGDVTFYSEDLISHNPLLWPEMLSLCTLHKEGKHIQRSAIILNTFYLFYLMICPFVCQKIKILFLSTTCSQVRGHAVHIHRLHTHTPTHTEEHSPHHGRPQREADWCPHPAGGDQGPWWETGY